MTKRNWITILVLGIAAFLVPKLRAQVNPGPGVARVSLIDGQVSTQRENGEWVAAGINQPLVTGDHISTGANSRAEVQLDYADVLRLGSQADAKVATLSDSQIQVQLAQGLADLTVMKGGQAQVEIDTPNVAVHPLEPGVYRIEVDSQSETRVTVRKGHAEVSTPQGSANLTEDQMMTVEGTENPQYQIAQAPGQDDWDRWNDQRNHVIEDARSYQYDNRYYTGSQDLDAYGHWQYVPGYDWCWTPYVDEGWIPYYNGRWAWEPFYGWTWVSYEPWGWAPYHYGRWFAYGNRWCWWPGPVGPAYRPLWAPAYVSFFGFGRGGFGVGVGFGFGSVGWLPVGPADPFYRWWGGRGGYRGVNVTNITNITNIRNVRNYGYVAPLAGRGRPGYSNLRGAQSNAFVRRALVTVPSQRFGTGGGFSRAAISSAQFRQAQFVSGRVPVNASRISMNAGMRAASRGAIPSDAVNNRRFFAPRQQGGGAGALSQRTAGVQGALQTRRSVDAGRTTFTRGAQAERQPAAANRSADWTRFGGSSARPQSGVNRGAAPTFRRAGSQAASGGFSRQASPSQRESYSRSASGGARPGWQRFGGGSARPSGGFNRSAAPATRGYGASPASGGRAGWQGFSRQGRSSYGSGSRGFSSGGGFGRASSAYSSRPPLELNRPVVTSRGGNGGYRGSWGGGYYRSGGGARSSGARMSGGGASRGGGGRMGGGGARGGGGHGGRR
ncbi:MAG: DUF6600 domain-containing protein [Terriglobia bacterium]